MPIPIPADKLDVMVRGFEPPDKNIILKSWLMGYRDFVRAIPDPLYFDMQKRLIFSISRRSRIAIACDRGAPQYILGFVVADSLPKNATPEDPLVVHWGWTRAAYRRVGLLRIMLYALDWHPQRPIYSTHWTHRHKDLQRRLNMTFNPYLIMDMSREDRALYSAD